MSNGVCPIDDTGNCCQKHNLIKVCFVTGLWKRHHIFEMFAEQIKLLQREFSDQTDIHVAVSGSEGKASRDVVEKYGFHYTETPNQPLGVKMNHALEVAQALQPDYCLMLGSDDLIGSKLMARYIEHMKTGVDFVYLTDCYFFDTVSKRGLYWGGYVKPNNRGDAAGVGKLISKSLLDKIKWNCFPPGFDRILDTGFDKQLKNVSHSRASINLKHEGLFALDIKSQTNMTPFAQWPNSEFMDGKRVLFDNLSHGIAEKIYGV
jgi:hypothetical protein